MSQKKIKYKHMNQGKKMVVKCLENHAYRIDGGTRKGKNELSVRWTTDATADLSSA
jgi:hypothetical protein